MKELLHAIYVAKAAGRTLAGKFWHGVLVPHIDPLQKSTWRKLHGADYCPPVPQIIERITEARRKNSWLFDEWSRILQTDLDVKGKVVMEIGFGGGWYLAQMLYRGASRVVGFEISQSVIQKATAALEALHLNSHQLYEVNKEYLNILSPHTIDLIYEITVFQHVPKSVTKGYLSTAKRVMKEKGQFICQFLMNETHPKEYTPYAKEGTVRYTHDEVVSMVASCGLSIRKYSNYGDWKDSEDNYWRLYVLE